MPENHLVGTVTDHCRCTGGDDDDRILCERRRLAPPFLSAREELSQLHLHPIECSRKEERPFRQHGGSQENERQPRAGDNAENNPDGKQDHTDDRLYALSNQRFMFTRFAVALIAILKSMPKPAPL